MKLGLIGIGNWGKKVLSEYLQLSRSRDIELYATDLLPANRKYCAELGVNVSDSPDALLDKVEAVHILTPLESHYSLTQRALQSGVHTLLEKPMARTSKEAFDLVDVAARKNLVLQVGHIFRFNNAVDIVRSMCLEGKLGRILHLDLQWTGWMAIPSTGPDIVFDLAPHAIDITNFILNEWPSKVMTKAKSYIRGTKGFEEHAHILLEFPDDKMAHIELSWITPGGKKRIIRVVGSERCIVADAISQKAFLCKGGDPETVPLPIDANNTILTEISNFVESILNRKFSVNSGYIGAKTVEVLETARRSMYIESTVAVGEAINNHAGPLYSVIKDCDIHPSARIFDQVNLYKCKVGEDSKIDAFVYVEGGAMIGRNVKIRAFSVIPANVIIEDDVFIGPSVIFNNNKYPRSKGSWRKQDHIVRKGASIGGGAIIQPGITIGEYAMVAAGAVVTRDVPPFALVAGVPARVVGRVDETGRIIEKELITSP